ncbi:MAG: tRNA (adenine-N1)-methyltransferase [Candidatus Methanomethylophilaceae archaeon]|nr:tRNA (adenine-N1)-methyltransferase [Thermoplasmata archaeon]MBQ2762947.1 tRNA (adenine-N1)-methyltransferase [Candidatus Methanomethylophilaceae archaeon]
MPFAEDELIYLAEPNGKKHWMKVSFEMLKIASLGTIDGSRLKGLDDGDVITVAGKEFTAFRPGTIELIESLERGAQIITPKDASTILLYTDVKAGDKVLEIGAGSGALTTTLLRAVSDTGHVHTVEFKEENALRALRNVRRTGLDKNWTYQIGDARTVKVEYDADALIMDMPDPEKALDNLFPCLRPGGRICAYIPNTNQLELIVNALRERKCSDIHAYENIQREMEVHQGGVRPSFSMLGHTAYLVFARKRNI